MLIDRDKVTSQFQNYVKQYDEEDPRVILKIEHTYRVAKLCEKIAVSLNLAQEDIELAWLIGMLHDIGRFEQLKNYGTFIDADSINHAHYGVGILFEEEKIRDFIESRCYDDLILAAIWYHNVYELPYNLDDRTILFCNLIRDADKIDILKVNVETPLQTIYNVSDEEIKQSVVTQEVMESFFQHRAVNHQLKKSPIDHIVGHISLVFELVFPISFKIVTKQGYLQQILDFQTENEEAKSQLTIIRKDMQAYMESKMQECSATK